MMPLIFWCVLILWGSVSGFHLWRFITRRRAVSFTVALYPLGWVVFSARELKILPREYAIPWVALALSVGVLAVILIIAQIYREFNRRWY